jgi:hypothetical protein
MLRTLNGLYKPKNLVVWDVGYDPGPPEFLKFLRLGLAFDVKLVEKRKSHIH